MQWLKGRPFCGLGVCIYYIYIDMYAHENKRGGGKYSFICKQFMFVLDNRRLICSKLSILQKNLYKENNFSIVKCIYMPDTGVSFFSTVKRGVKN